MVNKKFDVIIATYKRPQSLCMLVSQILECTTLPENIIIIDSSPDQNEEIQSMAKVRYIRSSHGNQPYQRYVGYLASRSEILVYFDDDMRVVDTHCFEKILKVYENKDVVGVQPNFTSKHDFFDNQIPKSKIRFSKIFQSNSFKKLTGYPSPERGKFWLAGIKGRNPEDMSPLEWFYGPVFSGKKELLYQNFNFNLFKIFEEKMGMGEDAILGFTLSKYGNIVYIKKELFHHHDQSDSTYSSDFFSYGKRVAYSRLYLSYEYVRLSKKSYMLACLHYNWYILWRILGMIANQLISYKSSRSSMIRGYFSGWWSAIRDTFTLAKFDDGKYWKEEALKDLQNAS